MKPIFAFLCLICTALSVQANLFNHKSQYLTADEAFIFNAQEQGDELQLHWQIADGYYLYKKEIKLLSDEVKFAEIPFPTAERHDDDFFGEVEIYQRELSLPIPILSRKATSKAEVIYQGCTKGFCYPPESKIIEFSKDENLKTQPEITALLGQLNVQQQFAQDLSYHPYAILGFFLLGLGLAFTPCVLPMLPLLSAIVIGSGQRPNSWRAFGLSLCYVQGMAFTYSLLGLIVASLGLQFQIALQSPAVLISLSLLFVVLALSMFGLFELKLPNRWQNKLNQYSQQQKSGAFVGVFVMGMIAGLVASPCTSAPLSGALLYVAQTGNLLLGGLALYLLALGMGLPLIAVTLFGNKILPKSGAWTENVKIAFGFVMLAMPIFLFSRLLASHWEQALWGLLISAFFLWLAKGFSQRRIFKLILLSLAVVSLYPLGNAIYQQIGLTEQKRAVLNSSVFQPIHNLTELKQQLQQHKITMLDLYADWCVACKEFERDVFSVSQVQQAFKEINLLRVDMTKNSSENQQIMQAFAIQGLPTILFFDQQGNEITHSRITGFLDAEKFLMKITQIKEK